MRATAVSLFAVAGVLAPVAASFVFVSCTQLQEGAPVAAEEAGVGDSGATAEASAVLDAAAAADAGDHLADGGRTYEQMASTLDVLRKPGPLTRPGSRVYCTPNYLVWHDADASVHSWRATTGAVTDYAFKASPVPDLVASDELIAVPTPVGVVPLQVQLYATGAANQLVRTVDYAYRFGPQGGALVRLDQRVNNVDLGGTKIRLQQAGDGSVVDITGVLGTAQPQLALRDGIVVVPSGVVPPLQLFAVDLAAKSVKSLTFSQGSGLQEASPSAAGLVVSYSRASGVSGLVVYKNYRDDAASRYEIADDVNARPAQLANSVAYEHSFMAHFATDGSRVFYASPLGIWAYDQVSGALAPVQLNASKSAASIVDFICILKATGTLLYRSQTDPAGQVWAVSLADWQRLGL